MFFLRMATCLHPTQVLRLCRTCRRLYSLRSAMLARARPPPSAEALWEALVDPTSAGWRALGGPSTLAPVLRRLAAPVAQRLLQALLAEGRESQRLQGVWPLRAERTAIATMRSALVRALPPQAALTAGDARPAISAGARYTPEQWRSTLRPLRASPHVALRGLADDLTAHVRLEGPHSVALLTHLVQAEGWQLGPSLDPARQPGRSMTAEEQLLSLADALGSKGLADAMARDPQAAVVLNALAASAASSPFKPPPVLRLEYYPPLTRLWAAYAVLRDAGLLRVRRSDCLLAAIHALNLMDDYYSSLDSRAAFRRLCWQPSADNCVAAAACAAVAISNVTMDALRSAGVYCPVLGDLSDPAAQMLAARLLGADWDHRGARVIVKPRRNTSGSHVLSFGTRVLHTCADFSLLVAIVRSRNVNALADVSNRIGSQGFRAAMLGFGADSGGIVLAARVLRSHSGPLTRVMLKGGVTVRDLATYAGPSLARHADALALRGVMAEARTAPPSPVSPVPAP